MLHQILKFLNFAITKPTFQAYQWFCHPRKERRVGLILLTKKFRKISGDLLADQVSIPSIYCSFNLLEDGGLGILMLNTRRRLSVFPIFEYFFSLFQSVVFQYYVLLQENSSFYFNSLHGHVCHWLGLSKLLRSSFSCQDFLSLANNITI